MKFLTTTFLLLTLLIAANAQNKNKTNFEWLIGSWERTNNQPGKITTESWSVSSDNHVSGFGVTITNRDTVFYEDMSIKKVDKELHLVVSTPQHDSAVHFKITSKDKTSFTAENPANDFPKKITYSKTDAGLKATISGGGNTIDFLFKKVKD